MCGVIWKKAENGHKYIYGDVVLHIFWFSQGGSFFHETSWAVLCLVLVCSLTNFSKPSLNVEMTFFLELFKESSFSGVAEK